MELLLYANNNSPRLGYTCDFIFNELLRVKHVITTDPESFQRFDGPKMSYGDAGIRTPFYLSGHGLLFETGIREQDTTCFEAGYYKAFFRQDAGDFPFDILSASFYLLSRYEEWLPHQKDAYGRYAHQQSLAFREGFLHLPLVNLWVKQFALALQKAVPGFMFVLRPFAFVPTYDIDMAFSFRHKGLLRNLGGFARKPSIGRLTALARISRDPFDSFGWLDQLHENHEHQPIYFFLLAEKKGVYDKNVSPRTAAMRTLVAQHAEKYRTGIHPSWRSGDDVKLLTAEKELLEEMTGAPVTSSRQHYLRFELPAGYHRLIAAGITDDYSMGYGSINGFRASVAASFNWFDLENNEATTLRVHPFCFMDANAFYEQKCSPKEALREMLRFYAACREGGGEMITIWHNNFLGTDPAFSGWRAAYQWFFKHVSV